VAGWALQKEEKDKDPEAFNKRKEREDKNKKSFPGSLDLALEPDG